MPIPRFLDSLLTPWLLFAYGLAGRCGGALRITGPNRRDILRVYGPNVKGGVERVARQMAASSAMAVAYAIINRHLDKKSLLPLITWEHDTELRELIRNGKSAILYFHHVGAVGAQSAALHKLGAKLLIVSTGKRKQALPGVEYFSLGVGGSLVGAHALHRLHSHLRQGGMVFFAAEGFGESKSLKANCLGRRIRLRRGVPTLARVSGVPVIPIFSFAHRRMGRMHFMAGDRLPTESFPRGGAEFEQAMADEIARRFESFLIENPGEISRLLFRKIVRIPSIADSKINQAPESRKGHE